MYKFAKGFWDKTRLKTPPTWFEIFLLICIFCGALSVLSLFDWWFRSLHVVNRIYFYVISFFIWSGIFRITLNWYQLLKIKTNIVPSKAERNYSVAIFTTAAPGEPLSMFKTTFKALKSLKYPCSIYFLDGTDDPKFKTLACEFGFHHFDFSKVQGAKAGKVNEALQLTQEEFILILDPDHLVFPDFIDEVLSYFNDPDVGFVQVSQGYYNQYRSPVARAAAEQTYLFYGPSQLYYGSNQQAVAIGANCIFRRKALESIEGHAQGLAEDLLTALRLHANGWKSIYHPVIINRGLVPEDFDGFAKQQLKWARGLFEVLFSEYPKVFKRLTFSAKFRYWAIGTFYLVGIRTLFFLLVPIFYFLFGWSAVNMSFSDFIVRALPFAFFSLLIYLLSQRYLIDFKSEKGFYWRGMTMKFASWPVFTYAFFLTLINKKIPYLPTSKKQSKRVSIFFWPLLVYVFLLCTSFLYHYVTSASNELTPNNFQLQQQTLGMFSFSLLALFQNMLAIFIIFKSSNMRHKQDAWEDANTHV